MRVTDKRDNVASAQTIQQWSGLHSKVLSSHHKVCTNGGIKGSGVGKRPSVQHLLLGCLLWSHPPGIQEIFSFSHLKVCSGTPLCSEQKPTSSSWPTRLYVSWPSLPLFHPSLFLFLQHAKLFLTSEILHTLFPLPGTSSSSLFSWLFLVSSEFQLDCCLQERFPDHHIVSRISLTSSLDFSFASFMEVITAFLYLLVGMDGSHLFSP